MKEYWKEIKGFENYQISNIGNVRRVYNGSVHYIRPFMKNGYLIASLRNKEIKKNIPIHRLVALAFIDNPNNLPLINHKNYIRTDNRIENLEWCDAKYNVRYSLAKPIIGYNNKMAIIFEAITDVKLIGLSVNNVSNCLRGLLEYAHNMKWKYISKEKYKDLINNPKFKKYGNIGLYLNKAK